MKQFPAIPRVENAPTGLLDSGHLWIQEKVDGAGFRFRLRESGALQFGDRSRTFDADAVPLPYRHAVRHVRERFDREALRSSVSDVESVVFFGEATHRHAIDYDWERTPSVLGFDVWDADEGRFLPPDSVEQIYDGLGLDPVNAVEKEVRATDFDPEDYAVPDSAWYDGPPEGVVLRNKTGQRATLLHPDFREDEGDAGSDDGDGADENDAAPGEASAEELAERYVTRRRVERVASELEANERPVTVDAVFERVVEAIAREKHHRLFHENASVDVSAFRSEAAARTQEFLDT